MKIPKSLFSGTILVLVALFCFGMGVLFQMYVLHDSLFDMIPADTHIAGAAGNNNLRSVEREIPTPTLPPVKELSVIEEKIENIVQVVEKSLEIPASSSTRTPPMSVSETPFVRQYYRDIMTYVPPLVQAWRQAKVDWHLILPKHDSTWERFGKNQKGLRILVSKEEQLTDYLTMYRESGLAGKYGKDHGALASYTGCNILSDNCMVHNHRECLENQLCSWDASRLVCVDFDPNLPDDGRVQAQTCARPSTIKPGGALMQVSPADCKRWVTQPAAILSFDSEAQSMFYHWLAAWSSMLDTWSQRMHASRQSHFFLGEINDPMLFNFFGTLSDYCWRRTTSQVPLGTCFCSLSSEFVSQSRSRPEMVTKSILDFFNLQSLKPPSTHVKIGIISRRVKRFILNEYDLVDIAQEMGFECVLLPLERMTIYEQMREFRTLDVLVGMHGSGLDNVIFLHPGSVLLQLMPYKNDHRASFVSSTERAGVIYKEWMATDRQKSYFHWDLFEQANKEKLERMGKDTILEGGGKMGDHRETLMFWINQDVIVPEDEWRKVLLECVKASSAQKRGISVQ